MSKNSLAFLKINVLIFPYPFVIIVIRKFPTMDPSDYISPRTGTE